jgi:hypothetical protein
MQPFLPLRGHAARGGNHRHAGIEQGADHRFTHALCAAGDQRALPLQAQIEAHAVISRRAMAPRSSVKA